MGINSVDISLGKAQLTHPVQLLLVRLEVLPEVGRVDEAVRELEWEQPHLERLRCEGRGNRPLPLDQQNSSTTGKQANSATPSVPVAILSCLLRVLPSLSRTSFPLQFT